MMPSAVRRSRLEREAARLGLEDRIVFAGWVADAAMAEHFRLADAFVMPGRGEGFGIVYLEALACGVPVVASRAAVFTVSPEAAAST